MIDQQHYASVRIEGHTDDQGSTEHNDDLSARRAKAVAQWLAGAGVDDGLLSAKGLGETHPAVPNTSAINRAKNRRVEIRLTKKLPAVLAPDALFYHQRMAIDMKALARVGAEARVSELFAEIAEIRKAFPGVGGGLRPGLLALEDRRSPIPASQPKAHDRRAEALGGSAHEEILGGSSRGKEGLGTGPTSAHAGQCVTPAQPARV